MTNSVLTIDYDSVHWIVPIIGTSFFAPGFYLTFQSVLNYLGEAYPRHVASVFAANTFFRSSFGGALPLAAPRMLRSLGIGWSSSILGFIAVALIALPLILERVSGPMTSLPCLRFLIRPFSFSMVKGFARGASMRIKG